MCWFNIKAENKERALEVLRHYVTEAEPIINRQLRSGIEDGEAIRLLDSLFTDNKHPKYLYRWLPSQYVTLHNNKMIDKAYLSCSKDVDYFANHVTDRDLTCCKINTSGCKTIDVCTLLPDCNNEGEFILPRNLVLEVTADKLYRQTEFTQFLRDIHCDFIRDTEMIDIYDIESIRVINASIQI